MWPWTGHLTVFPRHHSWSCLCASPSSMSVYIVHKSIKSSFSETRRKAFPFITILSVQDCFLFQGPLSVSKPLQASHNPPKYYFNLTFQTNSMHRHEIVNLSWSVSTGFAIPTYTANVPTFDSPRIFLILFPLKETILMKFPNTLIKKEKEQQKKEKEKKEKLVLKKRQGMHRTNILFL